MSLIPESFKKRVRKSGGVLFGQQPKLHRIPFGPLKGKKIFTQFSFSPRMYFGIDEPWVAKTAQEYVQPGDVIYDIGAHIGYTCLLFAQSLQGSGSVHAFEILPSIAEGFLRKTIEANDCTAIATIHIVGLSDTERTIELPVGATGMTSVYSRKNDTNQLESCRLVSLDEYVLKQGLPYPSLMKIDVERSEIDCLRGGIQLIEKCSPRMIIEFHNLDLLKQGFSFMEQHGYTMYLSTGETVSRHIIDSKKHFHESVLCLPEK